MVAVDVGDGLLGAVDAQLQPGALGGRLRTCAVSSLVSAGQVGAAVRRRSATASSREKSRRVLTSWSIRWPLRAIVSSRRSCTGASGTSASARASSAGPSSRVSGVRSSWLTLAKKSLLAWSRRASDSARSRSAVDGAGVADRRGEVAGDQLDEVAVALVDGSVAVEPGHQEAVGVVSGRLADRDDVGLLGRLGPRPGGQVVVAVERDDDAGAVPQRGRRPPGVRGAGAQRRRHRGVVAGDPGLPGPPGPLAVGVEEVDHGEGQQPVVGRDLLAGRGHRRLLVAGGPHPDAEVAQHGHPAGGHDLRGTSVTTQNSPATEPSSSASGL